MNYTVSATSSSGWLVVIGTSPNPDGSWTGSTPGTVGVFVNPSALQAGTYNGSVIIASNTASNSPLQVPVTLTVQAAAAAVFLLASPAQLSFNFQQGGTTPSPENVLISSSGLAVAFTATATEGWVSVTPSYGGTPSTVSASVNPSGLAPGNYGATISVTSPGASNTLQIPVTLTVNAKTVTVNTANAAMAQLASGGGWQTTFTLVNMGTSSAQAQLSFFDNSGNALSLPLTFVQTGVTTTTSTLSQTIAADATLVILTQGNNAGPSVVGSAQLSSTGNVGGFAIFRYNPTEQEAVVPLETRNASAYVLAFDNTNGLVTGLALANVANQAVGVPVVLRDDTGVSLGTATVNLEAHGHTSFVLTSSYASVAGKRGTVEFDAPAGGQISVLGLRATPTGAVTTIPVFAK